VTSRVPPRIATWLLEHLGPGYRNESLAGDLFEEYQQDRTRAWYWREVIAAICIGRAASLRKWLPRLAAPFRSASGPRRSSPIKRLLSVFAVTALSAGTLTWAGAAPRPPQQCTPQGSSPHGSAPIVPGYAGLDGQVGGR
jgi:hypothetical protein